MAVHKANTGRHRCSCLKHGTGDGHSYLSLIQFRSFTERGNASARLGRWGEAKKRETLETSVLAPWLPLFEGLLEVAGARIKKASRQPLRDNQTHQTPVKTKRRDESERNGKIRRTHGRRHV